MLKIYSVRCLFLLWHDIDMTPFILTGNQKSFFVLVVTFGFGGRIFLFSPYSRLNSQNIWWNTVSVRSYEIVSWLLGVPGTHLLRYFIFTCSHIETGVVGSSLLLMNRDCRPTRHCTEPKKRQACGNAATWVPILDHWFCSKVEQSKALADTGPTSYQKAFEAARCVTRWDSNFNLNWNFSLNWIDWPGVGRACAVTRWDSKFDLKLLSQSDGLAWCQ